MMQELLVLFSKLLVLPFIYSMNMCGLESPKKQLKSNIQAHVLFSLEVENLIVPFIITELPD